MTIGQDQQGFAWIGTLNNAYRFDGQTFRALPSGQTTGTGRVFPVILAIRNDPSGNLWFFKNMTSSPYRQIEILLSGQQKPSSFENLFHRKLPFKTSDILNLNGLHRNSSLPAGLLLVPTRDGTLWRYEGQGRFQPLYRHRVPSATLVNLFVAADRTVLLVFSPDSTKTGQKNQLIELWPNGRVRRQRQIPAGLAPVWSDSSGTVFLCNEKPFAAGNRAPDAPRLAPNQVDRLLYRLASDGSLTDVPIRFRANPFPDPGNFRLIGNKMVYDAHHDLFWVLGKNVLFAWHPKHGIVFDLAASGFPIATLSALEQVFVDRTGAVWISTQNGFLLMTVERNRFQRYFYQPDHETVTSRQSTRGIVRIGDWLWANNNWPYTGVSSLMNLKTGQSQRVTFGAYGPAIRGRDNQIWTLVLGNTLARINPATLAIQKYPLQQANSMVWALWQDGRTNFWLGYDEGLSCFNTHQQQNRPFSRYNQYRELANNRVNSFCPDTGVGGAWVAASSGLYLLDTLRGITARYSSRDAPPRQLPFDHITYVHRDRTQPGIYWLATFGGGLIRWERGTGRWQQFTRENGLSNNDLYSIHEDRRGRLWLPSNYGLTWFQKQTHQTGIFLPRDGITHEEFNFASQFESPDGQLFLGGLNGITALRPDEEISEKSILAPLLVTRYEQLDATTGQRTNKLKDYQERGNISLRPPTRSFSLTFALLDYRYGQQFRLWYRIVNWQDYWSSQPLRDLSINGLPPGRYQLQVRAQNPNGQWASEIMTIPIKALKPFYQQTSFFIVSGLILLGFLISIFRWRNRRLIQETKRLEEEVTRRTAQIIQDKALIEQQAADLQASATLKSRFFANVSHEFRTPLTLLLGPLAYLSKQLSDPALVRLVNTMDRNARHLLTMVSDLLDLSKLDVNQMQLTQQPAELSNLINQTVAKFSPQADFTGIRLTAMGTNQPLWMLLDVLKVETVLNNLLANALKFTPAGGQVTVQVRQLPETVQVEVTDTGSGIHPDDVPHIFERYYQSRQPDAPLRGGTGIGLALSYEYCQLWGGKLAVVSQLQKGSSFSFTYPYQPVAPAEEALFPTESKLPRTPVPSSLPADSDAVAAQLLLVEDNSDMVHYLTAILSPSYLVHVTRNGREAWQWLKTLSVADFPQLILTDLMMPDMDGLALVNEIRQHPGLRDIPVLMLTARNSQDVKLQALRLGVADYMTKPFDEDELLTRISNLLERSQERQVWQQHLTDETASTTPASAEEEWLLQLQQITMKNLANRYFQVNTLAEAVNSSERQLYRRLKKLTGFSPNQFIQEVRLQAAREWLEKQTYITVKEVCFAVGFQDPVYFSRLFLQRFGKYPASFLRTPENA
ncbi:hybrid sensor histidine kinase/response regulator transcription factor [Larkinella terrae]|nr:response regulator [Larkinella terrae]